MLFNSPEYLFLFLPVALLGFLWLSRRQHLGARLYWLIMASLVFYASWKPVYVLLIFGSIGVNFFLGRALARAGAGNGRGVLTLGLFFNLGLLAYFKYTGFFLGSLNDLGLWLIPIPEITLPLAISFFTFQQIAYLVDVHRGECEDYQFSHYALFVLFFPQLIAGPIVHHKEMMPQFDHQGSRINATDITVGLTIIAIGLFKKIVIADTLSEIADPTFAAASGGNALSLVDAWIATLAFNFQIYFDFSGYSDIAIGSARLFGIKLPENFNSPYKSTSIIEIWRRWHMTLSRFLRDYVYISLGGNRKGTTMRYINLFLTMLLGGLWHGAAWTYVIWGGLHGLYLSINHAWRALTKALGLSKALSSAAVRPLYVALTFLAWSFAFVVFRSPDMATASHIIVSTVSPAPETVAVFNANFLRDSMLNQVLLMVGNLQLTHYGRIGLVLAIAAFICFLLPNTQQIMARFDPVITADGKAIPEPRFLAWRPGPVTTVATAVLLSLSLLSLSSVTEFIYFQF